MIDRDAIVLALASGRSVAEVAVEHGLSETAIKAHVDEAARLLFDGEHVKRGILFEAAMLQAISRKYFARGMGNGETAAADAIVFIKASERLSTMLGRNAPLGHAVTIAHTVSQERQLTTTDEMERAIDAIRGVKPEERALKNKRLLEGKLTIDEEAELARLVSEREAKRVAKLG